MAEIDWDDVNRVPILDVLAELGIEPPDRSAKTFCVHHGERSPSMHIYVEENRWHSYCCGEGGNVVNLVEVARNVTRRQAAVWLQTIGTDRVATACVSPPNRPLVELSERVLCEAIAVWPDSAHHDDARVGTTYRQTLDMLANRWGLDDPRRIVVDFRLFLHPGSGLWVPHWQPDGPDSWLCHGVRTRPVTGDLTRKFSLTGSTFRQLYRPTTMAHHVETLYPNLILCEGESDTWAMYAGVAQRASARSGFGDGVAVAGLPGGAGRLTSETLADIERHRRVFLFMDDDEAGREAARRIAERADTEVIDMTSSIPGGRVAEARATGWIPTID